MLDLIQQEIDSQLPGSSTEAGSSRRVALKLALGAAYAAAFVPEIAQSAVLTPEDGLETGEKVMDVEGQTVPFYFARPANQTNLPVVLVVHEIFGVHAYIADTCRRFAKAGYLAIAVDLFARQGDAASYTDMGKIMSEIVSKVPDEQVMQDLDTAVQWAAENGGDVSKLAVTGFCWGGRITWLYSAHNPQVRAGVAWYGRLVGTASDMTPKHPVQLASELKAPVLGLYGGKDGGIPVSTIDEMKAALQAAAAKGNAAAKASEFVIYPEAGHAFHADYRPSYRKEEAEDGFKRALQWFKSKL